MATSRLAVVRPFQREGEPAPGHGPGEQPEGGPAPAQVVGEQPLAEDAATVTLSAVGAPRGAGAPPAGGTSQDPDDAPGPGESAAADPEVDGGWDEYEEWDDVDEDWAEGDWEDEPDAALDAALDAPPDAPPDAALDAALDAAGDAPGDDPGDAAPEAGADTAVDAPGSTPAATTTAPTRVRRLGAARPRIAQDVIDEYGMQPIADEGGWFAMGPRTQEISSILLLLTDAPYGFSAMHRLAVDEGWQWLDGDPVALLRLRGGGTGVLNLLRREQSQFLVRRGTWMGAATMGRWSLLSCWCAPAFRPEHFTIGERAELVAAYPHFEPEITALTRGER